MVSPHSSSINSGVRLPACLFSVGLFDPVHKILSSFFFPLFIYFFFVFLFMLLQVVECGQRTKTLN